MIDNIEASIASQTAKVIIDYAENSNKNHFLDELVISSSSEKDGSAVLSFEWEGPLDNEKLAQEMIVFFAEIKACILRMGKETVEQVFPEIRHFGNEKDAGVFHRIVYRFRIWPQDGAYENFERKFLSK